MLIAGIILIALGLVGLVLMTLFILKRRKGKTKEENTPKEVAKDAGKYESLPLALILIGIVLLCVQGCTPTRNSIKHEINEKVVAVAATVLFFGVVIIGILLPAIVSASKAHGMANGGYGTGTTITNPEPPTYQPVPSVEEPPAIEEPIVGEGGVSILGQPIPNLDDYLKNATVIAGFALLEIALSMAHSSALARIWRRYSHPTETHHIVPQNAVDRYHGWLPFIRLYMVGINPAGVNMGENTIVICTLLHKGLHNDAYYNGIATIFHYPTLTPLPEGSKPFMDLLKVVYGTIKATDEIIRTLF
ncbi:MAG: hypothetical protein K6G74_04260 [Bacilli bacterium]|nr:hypothetical protein [Bacilli bacterium]